MAAAKSDEIKAQVLAALLAGQGVRETARQFAVHHTTVLRWWNDSGLSRTTVAPDVQDDITEEVVATARALLRAVGEIARQCADSGWREKQSATDLADLAAILADRSFRILGAIEDAGDARQT